MELAPAKAGLSARRLEQITDHMERNYIAPAKIAGAQIAVSRHGHLAYWRSFGCADRERNLPVADDTIFRIYSMTKPITSIALMQLYERGYFQLNDPVSRVFPAWKGHRVWVSGEGEAMETRAPEQPMTFRHVLSHTGGLTYGMGPHPVEKAYRGLDMMRRREMDLDTMVERLAQVPLMYEPGSRWLYSLSTDVCGALVQAISGKRFDRYLQEEIFEPLGMKDTAFFVAPEKASRLAANYQRGPDKQLQLIDDPATSQYLQEPTFFSGGGGLASTTADYLRFCEALRRGGELDGQRIIGSRTLALMHQNHLAGGTKDLSTMALGTFSETAYDGVGFGLGFAMTLGEVAAGTVGAGDYYWGGAASTIFWVDPNEDLSVVFMTQLLPSATFNFRGQLKSIIYGAIEEA